MVREFPLGAMALGALLLAAIVVFMLGPLGVVVAASLTAGQFLTFPPQGLSLRWYGDVVGSSAYVSAAWTSATLALAVTLTSVAAGTLGAIALSRRRTPGAAVFAGLFLSPLVLPTIVLGLGLLILFSVYAGGPSLPALWIGHAVVTIPYVVRTVTAVLADADPALEEAARTMGAGPLRRLWFVTLPQCRRGMIAGAFFAFNISFDEAVIALFLRTPGLETLPLRIYSQLEFSATPAVAAASALMIALTVALLFLVERSLGVRRVAG